MDNFKHQLQNKAWYNDAGFEVVNFDDACELHDLCQSSNLARIRELEAEIERLKHGYNVTDMKNAFISGINTLSVYRSGVKRRQSGIVEKWLSDYDKQKFINPL